MMFVCMCILCIFYTSVIASGMMGGMHIDRRVHDARSGCVCVLDFVFTRVRACLCANVDQGQRCMHVCLTDIFTITCVRLHDGLPNFNGFVTLYVQVCGVV